MKQISIRSGMAVIEDLAIMIEMVTSTVYNKDVTEETLTVLTDEMLDGFITGIEYLHKTALAEKTKR